MILILCFVAGILWALRAELAARAQPPVAAGAGPGPVVAEIGPETALAVSEGQVFGAGTEAAPEAMPQPLVRAKGQLVSASKLLVVGTVGKLLFAPLLWFSSGVVLARALAWHAEHRVFLNGSSTVVLR